MARVQITRPADSAGVVLDIALSERNLIVLLSKLYTPGSGCTLAVGDVPGGFEMAWLRAEPDELHYASPTREGAPPGPMHPLAELILITVRDAVAQFLAQDSGDSGLGPLLWQRPPQGEGQL
jgi:hypothetical protein